MPADATLSKLTKEKKAENRAISHARACIELGFARMENTMFQCLKEPLYEEDSRLDCQCGVATAAGAVNIVHQ